MPKVNFGRFAKALEDPAYVAVGVGVLGFQRAQVCRRSLERQVKGLLGEVGAAGPFGFVFGERKVPPSPPRSSPVADVVGDALGDFLGEFRHMVDDVQDAVNGIAPGLAEHLPREAQDFMKAATDLANDLPREARGMLSEAVAIGRFALHALRSPVARRAYP